MNRILLLSAYDGVSHRFWREHLASYLGKGPTDAQVTMVTQPARHFSWRQRGNSLGFAFDPALAGDFDLIIATSVTDLSALRGMNRHVASLPAIVYFHENQFAYPDQATKGLIERQLTSIYTALSADCLFFNSRFNLDTFMSGAARLLERMPDGVPVGLVNRLRANSQIVPVALDVASRLPGPAGNPLRIAWNHRWEQDKGPALLLDIARRLLAADIDFELGLFGQRFRRQPAEFDELVRLLSLAGRLKDEGYIESRKEYLLRLASYDMVLSTAQQEFQGLAVQEAIMLGCMPVVPDALCYPEYVPASCRYGDAAEAVTIISHGLSGRMPLPLTGYQWDRIGPAWDEAIASLLSR